MSICHCLSVKKYVSVKNVKILEMSDFGNTGKRSRTLTRYRSCTSRKNEYEQYDRDGVVIPVVVSIFEEQLKNKDLTISAVAILVSIGRRAVSVVVSRICGYNQHNNHIRVEPLA